MIVERLFCRRWSAVLIGLPVLKMKKYLLIVFLLAFTSTVSASTVGNNDWEGNVTADYTDGTNWQANAPAGFDSNRSYADYTRWLLNVHSASPVTAIANGPVIDGTLLMQRTRVFGDTVVTVANGGVYDAWSFQIGGYGGDGHLDVQAGGLMTIDTVENNYVANVGTSNAPGSAIAGLLNIDGTVNIELNGNQMHLGSASDTVNTFGQVNIGSGGIYSLTGGSMTVNSGQVNVASGGLFSLLSGGLGAGAGDIYLAMGATYERSGDWTAVDLINEAAYTFDAGSSIDFDYDGTTTKMTVVPEPMTMALLGIGGLALLGVRRARRTVI
jgi:hypothetical protein